MKRLLIQIILALILLAAVVKSPLLVPYTVQGTGRIVPQKEWVLSRDSGNNLNVTLHSHSESINRFSLLTQRNPGDAVTVTLHDTVTPGAYVDKGDTVGWIDSNEINLQITRLAGELTAQRLLLSIAETGDKESVVTESAQRLLYAQEEFETQRKQVEHQKELYENGLIPRGEYESGKNMLPLFERNVDIAEAQFASVRSGAKQEEIDMIRSGITALEKEIEVMEIRRDLYTLLSPFSGVVLDNGISEQETNEDTVVRIGDTSSFIVQIPLNIEFREYIQLGQEITFGNGTKRTIVRGNIIKIDTVASFIGDEQVVVVTGKFDPGDESVVPYSRVQCSIECEPVSIRDYLSRKIHKHVNF